MVNNSLNPIPDKQPKSPSPIDREQLPSTQNKNRSTSSKRMVGLFPEIPISELDTIGSLKLKQAPVSDAFLQELKEVLTSQGHSIEKQILEFKENKSTLNFNKSLDAILDKEGLDFDLLNFTNQKVQEGVDFLEKISPPSRFSLTSYPQQQKLKEISNLGFILLASLSNESKQMAIIYKLKLIEKSKELLNEFKANFTHLFTSPQIMTGGENKKGRRDVEQNEIQKEIEKWEVQIALGEKEIKTEKKGVGISKISLNPFIHFALFFKDLSQKAQVMQLKYSFSQFLNLLEQGRKLKKIRANNSSLKEWKESYQKWREGYNAKIQITQNGAQRIEFNPIKPVILSAEQHEKALLDAVKNKRFYLAKQKLKNSGIQIPLTITTKKQLIDYLKFHSDIIKKYVDFRQKIDGLNMIISTSANLLIKRRAIVDKKVLLLTPRFHIIEEQIKKNKNQTSPIAEKDKENLMREYIDHQETIEHTLKNSLKEMVQQKLDLESKFQSLKSVDSHTQFSVSSALVAISITCGILGLLTIPLGGFGVILLALSIGSTILAVGFLTVGYIQFQYYKPQTSKVMTIPFQVKMSLAKLRKSIAEYSHHSKEKKLTEIAKVLYELHLNTSLPTDDKKPASPKYQKALIAYQAAKKSFETSQENVGRWRETLKKFDTTIAEAEWEDFLRFSSMEGNNASNSFDRMNALQEALKASDFRFLSEETKELFKNQLGINLEELQDQMKKNPEAVKNSLQIFFALKDATLFDFIRNQQARMKKGTINDS